MTTREKGPSCKVAEAAHNDASGPSEQVGAALIACRIKGPYYPNGDLDWTCATHGVEAVLRDSARYGAPDIRRADFVCPTQGVPHA